MRPLRTFLHTVAFWGYFIGAMPVLFPPALLLFLLTSPFDRRGAALHYYTCVWCAHHLWLNPFWRRDYQGHENVPKDRPVVIVSNHNSSGDIAVLFSLLLPPFKFVSKVQNFYAPFLGWTMYLNRYVPLRRGDRDSVATMMASCRSWLDRGVSIMMFPEGTRSRTGDMLPFRPGAFQLAIDAGVAVLPVVLDGTFEAIPPSELLTQDRIVPIRVRILPPVESKGFTDPAALGEAVREVMLAEQARLRALPDAGRTLSRSSS